MNGARCQRQTLVDFRAEGQGGVVSELRDRIAANIDGQKLLVRRQKVLLGVSGGLDSMVLLHLLCGLSESRSWKLGVVHVNHGLRGRASGADARFVARQAEQLGLPFFGEKCDVKGLAATGRISIEMAARKARHEIFAKVAQKWRCRSVALAHHLDDQVELFFLRLFRGAGRQGLGGMKPLSLSPESKRVSLVRPLLDVNRAELEEYARVNGIRFREDKSNSDESILRNRIRHRLIPLMKKDFQPALTELVGRTMDLLGEEQEFLESQLGAVDNWADLPLALRRIHVRRQLIEQGVHPGHRLTQSLLQNIGRQVAGPGGLMLRLDSSGSLAKAEPQNDGFTTGECLVDIAGGVRMGAFAGLAFEMDIRTRAGRGRQRPEREVFDADAVGPAIGLRHWRPGDRFRPIGMRQDVKLQDLFVNSKVPRAERRIRVLAENTAGVIFWVEGMRIGEVAKIRPSSKRFLEWKWSRE